MRILFLSSWYPFPPDNGSRLRVYHLLQGLLRKHQVTLFAFYDAEQSVNPSVEEPSLCERIIALPRRAYEPNGRDALAGFFSDKPRYLAGIFEPNVLEQIKAEVKRGYDVVIASELGMADYAAEVEHHAKIFDEIEIGMYADQYVNAKGLARARKKLMWTKFARYLGSLIPRFNAVTVVSPRERERVMALGTAAEKVFIVPNGVDTEAVGGLNEREPYALIYNGAVTFSANFDAMRYFVGEILPKIRLVEPRAHLKITGRADQVAQNALAEDNVVSFTGYLKDVRPVVQASAVCVVPLREGGGTRLKILEAMALGTPVVSTSKGAEGLAVQDGVQLLIADTPQEFAEATLKIIQNPELGTSLAQAARVLVEREYDWRVVQAGLDDVIARVTETR